MREKIPFNAPAYQGMSDSNLSVNCKDAYNIYTNNLGQKTTKPGTSLFKALPSVSNIDGLRWWLSKQSVLAVSDTGVYKITDDSGTTTQITGATMEIATPATFCDNGTYTAITNGGTIKYTDNSTLTEITDPDAPTASTHTAFLDQFVLSNNLGTGVFKFADFITTPASWDSSDFFTAEASPDNLPALIVFRDEIVLVGQTVTEFWINDGSSPFSRLRGRTLPYGTIAKYSLVKTSEAVYWLTQHKQVVEVRGGQTRFISAPVEFIFRNMDTVSDCIAEHIYHDAFNILVFSFETEGETYIYNIDKEDWTRFSWKSNTTKHAAWDFRSYCYAIDWNKHLVGSRRSQNIYELDEEVYSDNNNPFWQEITTGVIDFGNSNQKEGKAVHLEIERGSGNEDDGETAPVLYLTYAIDGENAWSAARHLDLGTRGQTAIHLEEYCFGMFRSIQFKLYTKMKCSFTIRDAWMDFEVLDS